MPLFSWAGEFSMSVKIDGRDATVYQEKHHQEGGGRTRSEGWICSEVGKVSIRIWILARDRFCKPDCSSSKSYTIGLESQGYHARIDPRTEHKDISAHLRIDGVKTEGQAVYHLDERFRFKGPIDHNKQRRPYVFQKPVSVMFRSIARTAGSPWTLQELRAEDGDDGSETTINTAIGTLEIVLCRVQYYPRKQSFTYKEVVNLTPALSEKHKKGLLTSVTQ